jgi:hypothetical protein
MTRFCNPVNTPDHILVDDVLVPSSRNPFNLPLAITQVTVLVSAAPGESGTFNLWNFPVQVDGSASLPPGFIASADVTFTSPFEEVTFGDGITTLFTVIPNFTAEPGFGLFFLGLQGSSAIPGAGWMWADGPDVNGPTAYNYDIGSNTLFLNTSPPGFPPHLSYYLAVSVPEPSTLALLGLCLTALAASAVSRRRWSTDPPV